MQQTLSILVRQTLAATLVVCLVICCCQARMVIHGLSAPDAGADAACASGCCTQPSELEDEPETPTKRCQSCCVKGTGLRDTTLTLPAPTVVAVHVHGPAPSMATPPPVFPDRPRGMAACVDPPTLLRLRCALLV